MSPPTAFHPKDRPPTFALLGVGFVSQRHLRAIKAVGGHLVAACDTHDAVGVLDAHFHDVPFTLDPDAFFNHLEDARPDYVVICTPNHRHVPQTLRALTVCVDGVICEKPVAVRGDDFVKLETVEAAGKIVWPVLQLRHDTNLIDAKHRIIERLKSNPGARLQAEVSYVTPRGPWYAESWKGDPERSGGIAFNIGSHLFDLLHWWFGGLDGPPVIEAAGPERIRGSLSMECADVQFLLSTSQRDLPFYLGAGARAYRKINVGGSPIALDGKFTDLHTEVYKAALRGDGIRLKDVEPGLAVARAVQAAAYNVASAAPEPAA